MSTTEYIEKEEEKQSRDIPHATTQPHESHSAKMWRENLESCIVYMYICLLYVCVCIGDRHVQRVS